MMKRPDVLFGLQPTASLEFFFLFTLKVLNGREPLPKNAAADFWVRTSNLGFPASSADLFLSLDGIPYSEE
jgi:hypothetical protein